jgi:hypothetical protein
MNDIDDVFQALDVEIRRLKTIIAAINDGHAGLIHDLCRKQVEGEIVAYLRKDAAGWRGYGDHAAAWAIDRAADAVEGSDYRLPPPSSSP